mmetsp:Transcript_55219/g.165431  ORF Transcript_55219/g.165431 Transcript_55219/m.165431 type:complete len:120 (+) Transcript_55219:273-632(+)
MATAETGPPLAAANANPLAKARGPPERHSSIAAATDVDDDDDDADVIRAFLSARVLTASKGSTDAQEMTPAIVAAIIRSGIEQETSSMTSSSASSSALAGAATAKGMRRLRIIRALMSS